MSGTTPATPSKEKTAPYYETFANQIIEQLKEGTAPWQKPWAAGELIAPYNPSSGTVYKGINNLMLSAADYADPRFMTLLQANQEDLRVKKGEKAKPIAFWQWQKKQDALGQDGKPLMVDGKNVKETIELNQPVIRISNVFHVSQLQTLDGQELPPPGKDSIPRPSWNPEEKAEALLQASGVAIKHDQRDRAFYRLPADEIHLPPKDSFDSPGNYYSTALHELSHSTRHPSRLDRKSGAFGTPEYAKEELRAEIASWMLAQELGVAHNPQQNAAYVGSWVKALEEDPYEIVRACRDAEKIKEYVVGLDRNMDKSQELAKGQTVDELLAMETHLYVREEIKTNYMFNRNSVGLTPQQDFEAFKQFGQDNDYGNEKHPVYAKAYGELLTEKQELAMGKQRGAAAGVETAPELTAADQELFRVKHELLNEQVDLSTHLYVREEIKTNYMFNRNIVGLTPQQDFEAFQQFGQDNDYANEKNPVYAKAYGELLAEKQELAIGKQRGAAAGVGTAPERTAADQELFRVKHELLDEQLAESTHLYVLEEIKAGYVLGLQAQGVTDLSPQQDLEAFQKFGQANDYENEKSPIYAKAYSELLAEKQELTMEKLLVEDLGPSLPEEELDKERVDQQKIRQNSVLRPEQEFAEAVAKMGLDLQGKEPIMDGIIHRVPTVDGKPGSLDGAYVGHMDGHPAGFIQNHKSGDVGNWKYSGHVLTQEYKQELSAEAIERKAEQALERQAERERSERRAYAKYANATPAVLMEEKHPYLVKKGIETCGAATDGKGNLLIAGQNVDGRIQTVQTINPDGDKRFEKGCSKTGAFFVMNSRERLFSHDKDLPEEKRPILIAEGFATAASIHMATNYPVIVAFDSANLKHVAEAIHERRPEAPILICGDNDHSKEKNVGMQAAMEASQVVDGRFVMPNFTSEEKAKGLTDFNDLHQSRGLQALVKQVVPELNKALKTALSKVKSLGKGQGRSLEQSMGLGG